MTDEPTSGTFSFTEGEGKTYALRPRDYAREFAELCGWKAGTDGAGVLRVWIPGASVGQIIENWRGFGIVVDEMRSRGWEADIYVTDDLGFEVNFRSRTDEDHDRCGVSLDDPSTAALTAAVAALRAEATP